MKVTTTSRPDDSIKLDIPIFTFHRSDNSRARLLPGSDGSVFSTITKHSEWRRICQDKADSRHHITSAVSRVPTAPTSRPCRAHVLWSRSRIVCARHPDDSRLRTSCISLPDFCGLEGPPALTWGPPYCADLDTEASLGMSTAASYYPQKIRSHSSPCIGHVHSLGLRLER